MWNCQRCRTYSWTFSARLSTAVWFMWSCKAATMRRCRCGWPNTAWVSFACSDDSHVQHALARESSEYCLGIFRLFGRFPRQVVLYVGEPQLRMENELRGVDVLFRYGLIDMSASELEDVSMRVLDAKSVEELLR